MTSENENTLAAEALRWQQQRELPKGPANTDHYVQWQERTGWCLQVRYRDGQRETFTGMTEGELNRKRIEYSDRGFVGKVVRP